MFHKISKIIKICAYLFLFGNIISQGYNIAVNTSYLNTGQLMGVESMMLMLWSWFISFLISSLIYGAGVIIEYYEKANSKILEDLTK